MTDDVSMIHVRFASDGSVVEVSQRPDSLSPQQWFDKLSEAAPNLYQALAGGRGVFRLDGSQLASLKETAAA